MPNLRNYFIAAALVGSLYLATAQTTIAQSLITNGNFTSLSSNSGGELGYNETATGWTSGGYIFVFPSGNPGDTAVTSSYGSFSLYGPANGKANGLVLPPGGGNVLAADGAYMDGPLTQTITGLTFGKSYNISFQWAGAQQTTYTGATTESWSVSLGGTFTAGPGDTSGTLSNSQTTSVVHNASTGFTGWQTSTFTVTATGTSELLSFLANGTPTGQPPFSLLANVTMVAVPEPKVSAGFAILFAMLILAGSRAWQRHQKKSAST